MAHRATKPFGQLFDRHSEYFVDAHNRPHWSQDGAIVYITFRTFDSIPREVIYRWEREKLEWLAQRGIRGFKDLNDAKSRLLESQRNDFNKRFCRQREMFLDTCHGACLLRQPMLAKIVADSLLYFDGERCEMGDFMIMPNHVHLMAAFPSAEGMRRQCYSWMHWTARRINEATESSGRFWQEEPFDHLVRSLDQYEYLRNYIRENPEKAGLDSGEYVYRRYPDKL